MMDIIKTIVLGMLAFGGGSVSAAGIFALITSIGLINRFAKISRTAAYIHLYEEFIVAGATVGNIWFLFDLGLPGWMSAAGLWFCAFWGLIAGIYVGCFSVCLAETTRAIPVMVRRTRIAEGLGWLILALALGKGLGGLFCYLWLY